MKLHETPNGHDDLICVPLEERTGYPVFKMKALFLPVHDTRPPLLLPQLRQIESVSGRFAIPQNDIAQNCHGHKMLFAV